MGFMNWLMKGVGFETEEVYDDTIERQKKRDEKLELQRQKAQEKAEYRARKAQAKADRAAEKYSLTQAKDVAIEEEDTTPKRTSTSYSDNPEQYNRSSYVSASPLGGFGTNSSNVGGYGTKNVEFVYPTTFDEVTKVINFLKEGESVMLNLNQLNEFDAQRLLDCVIGAVYALNGNCRHVDNNIYLITPEGFNIRMPEQQNNMPPQ